MNAIQYINKLTTAKKNKVNKLTVREVEEETKNNFIAFVDDETQSFDVKLKMVNDEVLESSCDCKLKDAFCIHKTALLLHLSGDSTTVTTKTTRKKKAPKLSESQILLQDLGLNEITNWLSTILTQNKEVEMQFLMHFSKKAVSYEVDDIEKLISSSFTSIMAKRKKIELNELKKILELLNKVLAPVFDYLQMQIDKKKAFVLIISLIENLAAQNLKYTVPGTRFPKYIFSVIEKFALIFNQLQDEDAWKKQVTVFVDDLFNLEFTIGNYYLEILKHIHDTAKPNRKKFVSACIKKNLLEYIEEDFTLRLEFNSILLDIVVENNDFETVTEYFTIYPYENAFNIKFLNALKNIHPEQTIAYCSKCISRNSKIDYNLPYLLILEEIFTSQKNFKNVALVKHDKFQIDPNFEDYQFIQQHLDDKPYLSKFRANTLSRLRNSFHKHHKYIDVYFEILNDEKNYAKMWDVIKQDDIPLSILNKYSDVLFKQNHIFLLQSIAKSLIEFLPNQLNSIDLENAKNFVFEHYSTVNIKNILQDLWIKQYAYYPESYRTALFKKFDI